MCNAELVVSVIECGCLCVGVWEVVLLLRCYFVCIC